MAKKEFRLQGLTEEHKNFLKIYSAKCEGKNTISSAIINMIEEKMKNQNATSATSEFDNNEGYLKLDDKPIEATKQIKVRIGKKGNEDIYEIRDRTYLKKKQFKIQLLEHDFNNLALLAENRKSSSHHYLRCLLRNHLYKEHELLGDEIEILRGSNYQLSKIGINLNQIARAINSGEQIETYDMIEELRELILMHTNQVMLILRKNMNNF